MPNGRIYTILFGNMFLMYKNLNIYKRCWLNFRYIKYVDKIFFKLYEITRVFKTIPIKSLNDC